MKEESERERERENDTSLYTTYKKTERDVTGKREGI